MAALQRRRWRAQASDSRARQWRVAAMSPLSPVSMLQRAPKQMDERSPVSGRRWRSVRCWPARPRDRRPIPARVPKPARVRPRQPPPPSAMRSHRRCGFASRPRSAPGRPRFATDPMPNILPPRQHSIRGRRARSHAGPAAASADSCFSYRARRACASAASKYPPPLQTRRCHPTGSACRPGSRLRVAARFPERSRADSSHAPSLGRLCPQRPF